MEHEHNSRHESQTTVRRLRADREKDRSEFAFAQLDNERDIRYLRDELEAARREEALMRDQHENVIRDHKNQLGILKRAGHLYSQTRPRADSTGGDNQLKM